MPKFTHLTQDEKDMICHMKLDGYSGSSIAQIVHKSRQCISAYLNSLPSPADGSEPFNDKLPDGITQRDAFSVCHMFNCGLKMNRIRYYSELSDPEIYQIFAFVKKPARPGIKPKTDHSPTPSEE